MRLKASLISSQFAILQWQPPKLLADTVLMYHLNFRKLGSGDEYLVVEKVSSKLKKVKGNEKSQRNLFVAIRTLLQ
jgi:hypothetical protein